MQTKEYKNHFPELHNGMTLCRVQNGVAIYNETEIAQGIFLSYSYEGYAQLTDKNCFMGWAQDWGRKHRVFIFGKDITLKKFNRSTYITKEGANKALLFHTKRLLKQLAADKTKKILGCLVTTFIR